MPAHVYLKRKKKRKRKAPSLEYKFCPHFSPRALKRRISEVRVVQQEGSASITRSLEIPQRHSWTFLPSLRHHHPAKSRRFCHRVAYGSPASITGKIDEKKLHCSRNVAWNNNSNNNKKGKKKKKGEEDGRTRCRLHARIMREFACWCVYCGESGSKPLFPWALRTQSLTLAYNDYVSL